MDKSDWAFAIFILVCCGVGVITGVLASNVGQWVFAAAAAVQTLHTILAKRVAPPQEAPK